MRAEGSFTARCFSALEDVPSDWQEARRTPFQTDAFLAAWYATLGARPGHRAAIVEVRRGGVPSLLFPLSLEINGMRTLRFADAEVADNNAPLLGAAAPESAEAFHAAWLAAARAMPPADMLSVGKQPAEIAGSPNPMLWLGRPLASQLQSHPLAMGGSFEDYSRSRTKKFRKEQERVWRVFTRAPDASFELLTTPGRALAVLADMARLQAARMAEVGAPYQLDEPIYDGFYRALVAAGIASGEVVLGALLNGSETVAALLGVSNGESVAFVRLAHAGGEWANCSPGRLVIERTLMALHERGVRQFDFSIGDQHYKEPFGVGTGPLMDVDVPMTWRAWPTIAANRARAQLRQFRTLRAVYDRVWRQRAA
ncbi:MAG: GNAT family N-acetyltransferase [Alphaproteobacteria bacterium]|nr:GNAT family N-acetyltransferase [Alphaproteobacteria bacterium]